MTEAEKIRYAKMFVDKLANGIDPLTDAPIPEGEVIHQVRISRCLFYVSDHLRQMAEQKEQPPEKTSGEEELRPFFLSMEQRGGFQFSDEPIAVSEFVRRLNSLADSGQMKKLSHLYVTRWLLNLGALEEISDLNGKKSKRPTRKGEELGLRVEERHGEKGPYSLILYNSAAQHFLLDNLDGILGLAAQKAERVSTRERQGMRWTRPQEEFLAELFRKRVPIGEIAAALKRSEGAVRLRLEKLGLIEPQRREF